MISKFKHLQEQVLMTRQISLITNKQLNVGVFFELAIVTISMMTSHAIVQWKGVEPSL